MPVMDTHLRPGSRVCRCSGCGAYFGGVTGFDRHRVRFACVDPATVGLTLNVHGYWIQPRPTAFHVAKAKSADFSTKPYQRQDKAIAPKNREADTVVSLVS